MKRNNRNIAGAILIIVTLGFLISCPFRETFTGGLAEALFGAAMIGGIADWFGITALFRKPLGFPFRTEIIPRNREKIFDSLVSMVENELLTKEAIISKLDKLDISSRLLKFLDEQDGKRELSLLVNRLVDDMLLKIDPSQAGSYLGKLLDENRENLKLFPLFTNAVDWLSRNMEDERVISCVAEEVKEFILYPKFGLFVNDVVSDVFNRLGKNAEKETAGKRMLFKLVLALADYSDMSPSKLSARVLKEALEYFNSIKDPGSPQRAGLVRWLEKTAGEFGTNPRLQDSIEEKGLEILKRASISSTFTKYVYPYLKDSRQIEKLNELIEGMISRLVDSFRESAEEQAALNRFAREFLTRTLEENHSVIGQLVRSKLETFSNDMLVELIEDKAGNDLQIIRVNGSVVGGLVGMVLYLATFWLQR